MANGDRDASAGGGRAARLARSLAGCVRKPRKADVQAPAPTDAAVVEEERNLAGDASGGAILAAEGRERNLAGDASGGAILAAAGRVKEKHADATNGSAAMPGFSRTVSTASLREAVLEMSCDILCVRTMTVVYTEVDSKRHSVSRTGYNVKVKLPPGASDVEVTFSVVGGATVYKVNREDPHCPWVRDEHGHFVPEKFEYSKCPQHVQYFVRGLSLRSMVWSVDERQIDECLFEMVSKDIRSIRTMQISYMDNEGGRQMWSGTGYNVMCHIPSSATDVDVTFMAMGRPVGKVDRRDPKLPWVNDFGGQRLDERFEYSRCPQCVQYDIRGTVLTTHVSHVYEQCEEEEDGEADWLSGPSQDEKQLYLGPVDQVPAIGGVVDMQEPHSEYLLPAEVALFEPAEDEIFGFPPSDEGAASGTRKRQGARQIFLNTPLTNEETSALREFRGHLAKQNGTAEIPRFAELHLLRILQTCKFNMRKATDMIKLMERERVRRLPVAEAEVLAQLKSGFIYWHGRDRSCRPCLVVRCDRLGEFSKDREKAVQTMLFALEYIIRHGMVPGRVENWVVIVDLKNVLSVISLSQCMSLISTAVAIGNTLERVFCGRMVWVKIINMPGSALLVRGINSVVPAEKKHKVNFPTDAVADLAKCFEPNQLEQRYGGEQPDVVPGEAYPFRFFPNPRGDEDIIRGASQPSIGNAERSPSSLQGSGDYSLHESTDLAFHEGALWDTSAPRKAAWIERAKASSLTPSAAEAFAEVEGGAVVKPCRDVERWLELTGSAAAARYNRAATLSRTTLAAATLASTVATASEADSKFSL